MYIGVNAWVDERMNVWIEGQMDTIHKWINGSTVTQMNRAQKILPSLLARLALKV